MSRGPGALGRRRRRPCVSVRRATPAAQRCRHVLVMSTRARKPRAPGPPSRGLADGAFMRRAPSSNTRGARGRGARHARCAPPREALLRAVAGLARERVQLLATCSLVSPYRALLSAGRSVVRRRLRRARSSAEARRAARPRAAARLERRRGGGLPRRLGVRRSPSARASAPGRLLGGVRRRSWSVPPSGSSVGPPGLLRALGRRGRLGRVLGARRRLVAAAVGQRDRADHREQGQRARAPTSSGAAPLRRVAVVGTRAVRRRRGARRAAGARRGGGSSARRRGCSSAAAAATAGASRAGPACASAPSPAAERPLQRGHELLGGAPSDPPAPSPVRVRAPRQRPLTARPPRGVEAGGTGSSTWARACAAKCSASNGRVPVSSS